MGSSQIVDSGRFSGGRSNFSQTCSLLSRYMKENGSFGGLSLGLTHNSEPNKGAPTETVNFLPMIEKSGSTKLNAPPAGKDETLKKPKVEAAQMTIFYGGQVIVFNDFPADKAQEIMALASKSSAAQNHLIAAVAPNQNVAESATGIPNFVPIFGMQEPSLDSDLPIARKNSLARFLEKRRDRITANVPYPKSKPAPPHGAANGEAWLGLAPQLPLQIQRH